MHNKSLSSVRIHRLLADDRGAVAVLFGLLAMVLMCCIGLAVDFNRSTSIRYNGQAALDAAVLAASNVFLDDSRRQTTFQKIFEQNFGETDVSITILDFVYSPANGGHGKLKIDYPTHVIALFGFDSIDTLLESSAKQANFDMEVALVLDVSGSMMAGMGSGSRLAALKTSAKKLIQTLDDAKMPGQSVKYSIIPFTMNVNVGTSNDSFVENTLSPLFNGTTWAGCVLERPTPYHNQDVFNAGDAAAGGRWQAYIWPPEPNNGSTCVNPSNGNNDGYNSVQTVAAGGVFDSQTKGPNFNCVRHPIVSLTSSASDISAEIDALESHGNMGTILAPGIAWAHRVLSPGQPFAEGQAFSQDVRKIMIVITDGEQTTEGEYQSSGCDSSSNTGSSYLYNPQNAMLDGLTLSATGPRDMFSPYGYMLDSQPLGAASSWSDISDQLRDVTLDACNKFKAHDSTGSVELYTIAASSSAGPGTDVYDLLRQCATSLDQFYYADSADDLEEVFVAIAKQATDLRLTE